MNEITLEQIIKTALIEDMGDGDHSSLACVDANQNDCAQLLVKQHGVLAGMHVAQKVFELVDASLQFDAFLRDGDNVKPNDIAFKVCGNPQSILAAERLALNFMQRMSGIATTTSQYAQRIADLKTKVLDTRKTSPGLRYIEKMAVRIGGGQNHRFGLYDMVMLKDNHIDYAGGIEQAINKTVAYLAEKQKSIRIEIEVRNMDELQQVLAIGRVHRIMLDNFTPQQTLEAVKLIDGRFETESSGGITLDTIRSYALCGVDYVSVGALTHQIQSLDLSLKAV